MSEGGRAVTVTSKVTIKHLKNDWTVLLAACQTGHGGEARWPCFFNQFRTLFLVCKKSSSAGLKN